MGTYLLDELFQDNTDPHTPIFWETVHWLANRGADLTPPPALPEPGIGVQIMELQRQVALKTPTMAMQVIDSEPA